MVCLAIVLFKFVGVATINKVSLFGVMETLFTGKSRIFLPYTDSTNSYAMQLLKNVNPAEGTVVFTHDQRNGRGQRENTWTARPMRHITASFIFRPNFLSPENLHLLMMVAALGVHDTLAQYLQNSQYDIKIKWPNDILVNNQKIAGILIENNLAPGRVQWSVVGIGINVNETIMEPPTATSLKALTGITTPLDQILNVLCERLERYYLLLRAGKYQQLKQLYLSQFYALGQTRFFYKDNQTFKFKIEGISENGQLWLKTELGNDVYAGVKEYSWGERVDT